MSSPSNEKQYDWPADSGTIQEIILEKLRNHRRADEIEMRVMKKFERRYGLIASGARISHRQLLTVIGDCRMDEEREFARRRGMLEDRKRDLGVGEDQIERLRARRHGLAEEPMDSMGHAPEESPDSVNQIILSGVKEKRRRRPRAFERYADLLAPGQPLWRDLTVYKIGVALNEQASSAWNRLLAFRETAYPLFHLCVGAQADLSTLPPIVQHEIDTRLRGAFASVSNLLRQTTVPLAALLITIPSSAPRKGVQADRLFPWLVSQMAKNLREKGCKQPIPVIGEILRITYFSYEDKLARQKIGIPEKGTPPASSQRPATEEREDPELAALRKQYAPLRENLWVVLPEHIRQDLLERDKRQRTVLLRNAEQAGKSLSLKDVLGRYLAGQAMRQAKTLARHFVKTA
ncbi:MAG: hypothetical protein NTW86_30035 [Candidatus Sumerlaeota bacterium]|nr:hypothetical protein [Candidatus Sumerlaeota bacterium]